MILFDIEKTCSSSEMSNIINICKDILNIIHIIGPILCIISVVIIFIKMMANPQENKYIKKLRNSFIALVFLFLVPTIVNASMNLLGDNAEISKCWNNSERVYYSPNPTYIEVNDDQRNPILINPDDYEKGNETITSNTGTGLGAAQSIKIQYNVKDSKGRCGKGKGDRCSEVAVVQYKNGKVTYYMGKQNNSNLLGGSCRAHAFTCGMNAVNNSYYSTLDLQNYMKSLNGDGVFKGSYKYNKAIKHFNVPATAYFQETSIKKSYELAKEALANGQPVMIFVAHDKCGDLAGSHHALLLLGYDSHGNVIFLDSCAVYPHAKKRNLEQLILGCMSGDSIAKNWMRMVIFSFK